MPAQSSRAHLLAIDHDEAVRDVYEDLFAEVGFQVTVASPSATVEDVRAIRPDLVLLDWPYPWNEPPALLQGMRRTRDLATTPAIIASTAPERAATTLPADPHARLVPKPFTVEEILDCADLLLTQARELTRRSHALRRQLGFAQDRHTWALHRWTPAGTDPLDES